MRMIEITTFREKKTNKYTDLAGARFGELHLTSEGGGEGERDRGCRAYECSILPNWRTLSDGLQTENPNISQSKLKQTTPLKKHKNRTGKNK